MKIGLAVEIPLALRDIRKYTDLDFVLAHKVLEDEEYADLFNHRRPDRELILDNSMHELGAPLSTKDLLEAAKRVRADYIIAPDRLKEPEWNLEQYRLLRDAKRSSFAHDSRLAVVLSGNSAEKRRDFIADVHDADMLCLPYREPRLEWYIEQRPHWRRIHLLGMSSLLELEAWMWLLRMVSGHVFTLDTAKPVKAGIIGRRMNDGASLRHLPVSSHDLLEQTLFSKEQQETIVRNIVSLRHLLQGGSW